MVKTGKTTSTSGLGDENEAPGVDETRKTTEELRGEREKSATEDAEQIMRRIIREEVQQVAHPFLSQIVCFSRK